jgi:hypothetical protein
MAVVVVRFISYGIELVGLQGAGKRVHLPHWSEQGSREGQCVNKAMLVKRKGKKLIGNVNIL